jgi:hypothetical protein
MALSLAEDLLYRIKIGGEKAIAASTGVQSIQAPIKQQLWK